MTLYPFMNMTTITITDLKLNIIIGTKEAERAAPQEIIAQISFEYDAEAAANDDDLSKAVDYEKLTLDIIKETKNTEFFLLEKLCAFILDVILKEPMIAKAEVKLEKMNCLENAKSVNIIMKRDK